MLAATTAAFAAIVHLAAADTARDALGFTFPAVPDRPGEALAILANNARHAATIIACAALRGLPSASARDTPLYTLAAGCLDAIMARALLPHGPIELAAFALPLGLHLDARRRPITWRSTLWTAIGCLVLLAVSAGAETYG
jgi:hypothetical protein